MIRLNTFGQLQNTPHYNMRIKPINHAVNLYDDACSNGRLLKQLSTCCGFEFVKGHVRHLGDACSR